MKILLRGLFYKDFTSVINTTVKKTIRFANVLYFTLVQSFGAYPSMEHVYPRVAQIMAKPKSLPHLRNNEREHKSCHVFNSKFGHIGTYCMPVVTSSIAEN